jgi:hypothetical protein
MDAIRKIEVALPEVNYAMLAKHLGPNGANMLSRTVWKDGIDIEVPIEGIQTLVNHYATAAIASKEAEVERLMEILQSWKAAEDYAAKYCHLTEASEEIAGAWELATQARDAALNQNQGEPK